MGRHVLYSSNDGEPITVFELDVPNEVLFARRCWRVPVVEPIGELTRYVGPFEPVNTSLKVVEIQVETLRWPRTNKDTPLLHTANDSLALLLRPSFLAGQQAELAHQYRKAFADGFVDAIRHIIIHGD